MCASSEGTTPAVDGARREGGLNSQLPRRHCDCQPKGLVLHIVLYSLLSLKVTCTYKDTGLIDFDNESMTTPTINTASHLASDFLPLLFFQNEDGSSQILTWCNWEQDWYTTFQIYLVSAFVVTVHFTIINSLLRDTSASISKCPEQAHYTLGTEVENVKKQILFS